MDFILDTFHNPTYTATLVWTEENTLTRVVTQWVKSPGNHNQLGICWLFEVKAKPTVFDRTTLSIPVPCLNSYPQGCLRQKKEYLQKRVLSATDILKGFSPHSLLPPALLFCTLSFTKWGHAHRFDSHYIIYCVIYGLPSCNYRCARAKQLTVFTAHTAPTTAAARTGR